MESNQCYDIMSYYILTLISVSIYLYTYISLFIISVLFLVSYLFHFQLNLTMSGTICIYRALYAYKPAEQTSDLEDEEIQIEEGDVLEVLGPVENYECPDKWLKGFNKTKGTEGMFPGTFVKFIEIKQKPEITPEGKLILFITLYFIGQLI